MFILIYLIVIYISNMTSLFFLKKSRKTKSQRGFAKVVIVVVIINIVDTVVVIINIVDSR
jgi:hypothetical protein